VGEEKKKWICENLKMCEIVLDWEMLQWICQDDLLKFVNDLIIGRKFKNYFKNIKCKFITLSLLLKNLNNELWYFFFCNFELIKFL